VDILKDIPIKLTSLAQGIPSGSHIENLDEETLSYAVNDRRIIHHFK
jgi:recombinational DNA repair protein RecR